MAADAFDELARIVKPRSLQPVLDALDGKSSPFGVDGEWRPHHHGLPRSDTPGAFDGDALLTGTQAIAYLATQLPAGDPRRSALGELDRMIHARLDNPELLIYGGSSLESVSPVESEAVTVSDRGYLYFRPAKLIAPEDLAACRAMQGFHYPNDTFPWSGYFSVWETFTGPLRAIVARIESTPLGEGWEVDPRRSAPAVVAETHARLGLGLEDAAVLLLQLLALVDCSDAFLIDVNGWTAKQLRAAGDALVKAGLAVDKKQPRATRRVTLRGTWEALRPPHPAIEAWKLPLFGAEMRDRALAAPLGRLFPLRPMGEQFAVAWERFAREQPGVTTTSAAPPGRDWLGEIARAPDDLELRLVYADWLIENGDPRGELCRVQLALEGDGDNTELRAAEAALLDRHRAAWSEEVHSFVRDVSFERGLITGVTAHAPTLVKHAKRVFAALPFLDALTLDAGPVGPVPRAHLEKLVACEDFARFRRLDTTIDHYISRLEDLELLLSGKYLPSLRELRLGYHRANEGFGPEGAELIASCARFAHLRHLEVPGQNLGLEGVRRLLALPALEVLRVPYNGLRDGDARKLAKAIADGQAPKTLRVLDLGNTVSVDASELTRAVAWSRNRVSLEVQNVVIAALGGTPLALPPVEPTELLLQEGSFPFVARAKSNMSRCVVCRETIAKDSLRIGIERQQADIGRFTAWVHPACGAECPELTALPDLDSRLTENSDGLWPPPNDA